jgi:predicted ATPase
MGHTVALICDRSVLDAPTYVYSQGDRKGAQTLLNKVRPWIATYSTLFLLDPLDIAYATDDVRSESESTRQLFHEAFIDFFQKNGIHYELLSGSVGERSADRATAYRKVNISLNNSLRERTQAPHGK